MSVVDLAETYKVNGPTETCVEPDLTPTRSCGDKVMIQIIISHINIRTDPHQTHTLGCDTEVCV